MIWNAPVLRSCRCCRKRNQKAGSFPFNQPQKAASAIYAAKNSGRMKLVRTTQYYFGWLIIFPLLDVVFLMIFFLLLSSNFVLQPGISVNVPFSKFMLAPQMKYQIVSITSGGTVYFRDQKNSIDKLGSQLDLARKEGRSIIIKADRYTPYETVIRVANLALEHGVPSVALATTPPK